LSSIRTTTTLLAWSSATWLALSIAARAQQPASEQNPSPQDAPASIQEAGGRLVVSAETVTVTGQADEPRTSSIATKIDVPLIETPRSVSIVNREMLDELAVINVTEAHDYTVGFMPLDERGPGTSRGFPVDFYDLRRDGLRTYGWSVREPMALDRVQYLRGPASILYGDGSPGGLVNLVLKKPLPLRRTELSVSGGELGFGRLTGDVTGPITAEKTIRYRLLGSAEWLDNGFQNGERRVTFMPTFAFDIGRNATLTVDTEFYDQHGRNYRHAVAATADTQHGDFSKTPWDLSPAGPDDGWTGSNVAPGARLDAKLGRNASLHVAARYTRIDGDIDVQALLGLAPDGHTLNRYHYREISVWDEYQSDSFATFTARTGRIEHQFVTGIEAGLSKTDSQIGVGAAPPLDIYNPQYAPAPPEPSLAPTRFDVGRLGLYATDRVHLSRRVIVEPALRWSRIHIDPHVASGSVAGLTPSSNAEISPGVGVVVLPVPSLSFYATYAQGFEAPAAGQVREDGSPLEPMQNESVEGGVKREWLNGRMSATADVYKIHRTNVAEADVLGFYRQIAEAQSHGLELEATGSLTRQLGVYGGYAWCDADITRDSLGFVGRTLPNAPHHKANVWLRYAFGGGMLSRFAVSGGLVYVGDRFTASDNVTIAAAYTRADATAAYAVRGSRLLLRLVAQNLGDVRYVTSGAGQALFAGPPRRIAVQLSSAF
jgi:iron complex outermembrane receptor protein